MRVFKFGGASVKDADGVVNLLKILNNYKGDKIVVVVSAMGKTTNALEVLLSKAIEGQNYLEDLKILKQQHWDVCASLFHHLHGIYVYLDNVFNEIQLKLSKAKKNNYDFYYDQIVSKGELISTTIVEAYLKLQNCDSIWLDAREYILTDSTHRAARVDLEKTELRIQDIKERKEQIFVTQGFVAANASGKTTTLGREGSDYSAALFAYALKTEELVIWKDVDGVYNADPKIFQSPQLIDYLSYKEAVELAFYGASIIHPKTIQPLSERGILLKVKSFYDCNLPGTTIGKDMRSGENPASVIVKKNQLLLSLVPRDLSFTDLPNMSKALRIIAQHRHHVNLMQNSAVSFSICLDANVYHFDQLMEDLKKYFTVRYNTELVLVTIRNYQSKLIDIIYEKTHFKLEQRNRSTYQILVNKEEFSEGLFHILNEN